MRKGIASFLVVLFLFSFKTSKCQILFENAAQEYGISVTCGNTFLGNGITFFDYDNDGWDDLTIASSNGDPIHFLKNIGGFFVSQTISLELPNEHQSRQVNWVDIDNDGDNDLFVTSDTHGVSLFENIGNMVMQDITLNSGILNEPYPYYGASWGDYDNDGFLDVFISIRDIEIPSILYKNNGDKTFTVSNIEAGLVNAGMMSFCSAFLDYDNDGDQDIYVSNDKPSYPNLLYRNNGDSTFTEVGMASGSDIYIDAMSVTVDDVNYDGWLDIYVTNDDSDSALLINNHDGTFTDMASFYEVTFNSNGWGAIFLDADNDRDLDLYVSGETDGSIPQYLSSAFYENLDSEVFELNNEFVPNDNAESFSNAIGDIDNDGFTDFVVNNINHPNISLWKNNTPQTNNWLKVKLEGTVSNRNGVGSFIEISINGEKQYRYTLIGEGYLSQNSGTEIFGLGTNTSIDYVKVKWLSGIEDVIYNVNPNQTLQIVEGQFLSTKDNKLNEFSYFPNPVVDTLTFKFGSISMDGIIIYDILGKEITQIKPNTTEVQVDISHLESGTYFAKIVLANSTKTVKIIKQ